MSLSKIQRFDEIVIRRDSFSDRVCDDLSEVLLKYLSLEDKLKLECVSKQFQRTIFQKQYYFEESFLKFIGQRNSILKTCLECFSMILSYFFIENAFASDPTVHRNHYLSCFTSIVKKCPNIKTIFLYDANYFASNLEIISKNCINFPEIRLNFSSLSDELFTKYVEKFGPKQRCFQIHSEVNWNRLKSLPNIESLILDGDWKSPDSEAITQLNFDRLYKCEIDLTDENIAPNIDLLFDKFKSVRHLEINDVRTKSATKLIVKQFPKLKYLIDFRFLSHYSEELLKGIALNCTQLKTIGCYLQTESAVDFDLLFSTIKALKRLKRLKLSLQYGSHINQNIINFSLKSFKRLSNITHLKLYLSTKWKTDETFLEDIETVFPNLQFLSISFRFEANFDELKQQLIDLITRKERLEQIVFELNEKYMNILNEQNKIIFIKSSRKVKTIEFRPRILEILEMLSLLHL